MIKKTLIISALIIFAIALTGETSEAKNEFGAKAGVSFQIGTHIQRIGFMYQLYYYAGSVQLSHGSLVHFNRKNLGPAKRGLELQSNIGIQTFWGNPSDESRYLFNEFSLMGNKSYATGYVFKLFVDQVETSQTTGALFLHANKFGFVFENDLLGGPKGYQDKFRTGALAVSYQVDRFLVSLQTTHWTGKSIEGIRHKDPGYPSKYGYKDLTHAKYGKLSHGILAARADYYWKHGQVVRMESGVDAEQIRHLFQNKLVHDFLVPAKLVKHKNPHYPMLQSDGSPYLFKKGQHVRPAKFYFQAGLNQMMFY
jgi:hypothetical protein